MAEGSMHIDFAGWYSVVALSDDMAKRQLRWNGITGIVDNADGEVIEALVRLAFSSRAQPSAEKLAAIRHEFRKADETFELAGNDRELQILAGSCLVALMDEGGDNGAYAALSVSTAAMRGLRAPDLPMQLSDVAEGAISRIGIDARKRPSLGELSSVEAPKFDFEKAATRVREQPNWEGVAEAFILAADGARIGMRALATRQSRSLRAVDSFIRVQDEELQMLWWLLGERSTTYDSPFSAVPADDQPFIFGRELADATTALPGPPAIRALMSRAGLGERKKLSIASAVNGIRSAWLEAALVDLHPSPVTMPLHFAMARQRETGPGEAWVAGWGAATEVDPKAALSPLAVGELFYRERLLAYFG